MKTWKYKYFEKNNNELHTNIFKSLEMEKYLKKIFKNNSLDLHNFKINFSNLVVNIFVLVRKTNQKTSNLKKNIQINNKNINKFKIQITKKNFLRTYMFKNFSNKLESKMLYFYKQHLFKSKTRQMENFDGLSKKIIENLNLFAHNKFQINLILQEINFIDSNSNIKQVSLSFRKFEKAPFFKESLYFFLRLITRKKAAKSISNYIAIQLKTIKRHNFFFSFLHEILNLITNQKFSNIQGIKIIIAGRLSSATRSRTKIIKNGKISLLKISSKKDYSESVAYTSNGTFGIKVWICESTKLNVFTTKKNKI